MDLIIELRVTYKTLGIGIVSLRLEKSHRIHCRHGVDVARGIVPGCEPVQAIAVINRLGRIVVVGGSDRILVGIGVLRISSLTVQVDSEVVLEESRGKVEGQGPTVHLGSLEGTVLAGVATGDAVRKEGPDTSVQADVAVVGLGVVVDLFLPVSVGRAESCLSGGVLTVEIPDEGADPVSVKKIVVLGNGVDGSREIHGHIGQLGSGL